jgi:hypothetical protein
VFSQFWPCRFSVAGEGYRWAEQWMMAGKARLFGDAEVRRRILAATTARDCKRLGRGVRGFDEQRWEACRFAIVVAGNVAKFGQDPALREYLLTTGDELLVEAASADPVWGIGLDAGQPEAQDPTRWRGLNLLGFALVHARAVLRGELGPPALPF